MSNLHTDLLRAIELALPNQWDAAHELVQQHEDNPTASWIHAVLHKIEGDLANARYWYRQANQMSHLANEPRAELAAIQSELRSRRGA
jgi:ATP/maltotriose-dependent transcriptional regulator MalT